MFSPVLSLRSGSLPPVHRIARRVNELPANERISAEKDGTTQWMTRCEVRLASAVIESPEFTGPCLRGKRCQRHGVRNRGFGVNMLHDAGQLHARARGVGPRAAARGGTADPDRLVRARREAAEGQKSARVACSVGEVAENVA